MLPKPAVFGDPETAFVIAVSTLVVQKSVGLHVLVKLVGILYQNETVTA
jgi:hypothetical protein